MIFQESEDILRCIFSGKLETQTCIELEDVLRERITAFLQDRDVVRLVFDLAQVEFISSAFLRICLTYFKAVTRNFYIENPSPEVRLVFQQSGFTELLNIV